jgi:RNA polymerase sigma-70 factor (ECF subfamily)
MHAEPDREADVALMLRLKAGDDLALNALMDQWQAPLTAFVYRYIGRHEDALDLAQETFVRIFENRHRYEPTGKFSTWLFSIAANLCRNYVRWAERHPTVAAVTTSPSGATHDLLEETAAPDHSPADNAEHNDLASAVREHIQALPHELKAALLMFEYNDLSHQEIAAALHCTPKAIEMRIHRARQILHERLRRWKLE